ncbi:MAG: hypothetical protein KIS66_04780 [Fimbriimonadaceae bacterium]|nr:hypothetical protein [Fimbriimonadaceae bacterium]
MNEPGTDRRRGPIPIYPALVAAFPVLAVLTANLAIVPATDLGRPLLVALAAGVSIQILAAILWRNAARGAASAAVLLAWVWAFGTVAPWIKPLVGESSTLGAYAGLGLLFAAVAGRWAPRPSILNLVAGSVTFVSLANLGWYLARPPAPKASAEARREAPVLPPGPRPDVFYIVLDGFGREDAVKRAIGTDLSWFVQGLRDRGFQVAGRARANYVQTELSVTSSLNMAFLQTLLPEVGPEFNDRRVLNPLLEEPAVARRFQASGYRYLAVGSGFEGLGFGKYELPVANDAAVTLFEGTLLAKTPWLLRDDVARSQYDRRRERLGNVFETLAAMARPTRTPRFVVAHILAPHPPFVFGPNGEPRRPRGPYGYWDASDFLAFVGSADDYRKGYDEQVTYIAKRTLELVDALKEGDKENPPVIVLQGDHGSKLGLDQNSLEKTDLGEAFPILSAIQTPPDLPMAVPEDATPVNAFRRLFTAMGATDLPDLEERSWYSGYALPFDFVEVTERIGSPDPLPAPPRS